MLGTYSISRSACTSPNQTDSATISKDKRVCLATDVLHVANSYSHEHVYELTGDIIWACVLLLGEVTNSQRACVLYILITKHVSQCHTLDSVQLTFRVLNFCNSLRNGVGGSLTVTVA